MSRRRLVAFALVAACAGSSRPPAQEPAPLAPHAGLAAAVDAIADRAIRETPLAGLSIAVIRGGEVVVAKGYGRADVENDLPATADTIYRIGSVTKQFTAAAILKLVEAGRISLDDDLRKYLPDYPTQEHVVTIHHLLNHTSGIKSYTDLPDFAGEISRRRLARDELVKLFAAEPFEFAPGERWHYNNSGYYLLGLVIEKVTGTSYAEHLRHAIFEPLGLAATTYCDEAPIIPRRAQGYAVADGRLANDEYLDMAHPYAAGALCSTVGDLAKWAQALAAGRVVSPESYAKMIAATTLADGSKEPYGYGLGLGELGGHRAIQHGGGINGFVSMLAHYPDDDLIVVVLVNTESGAAQRVAAAVARAALGVPEPQIQDLPLTPDEAAVYAGTYRFDIGLELVVTADGGRVRAQAAGQPTIALLHQGQGVFVVAEDTEIRLSFVVEGGRAVSVKIEQNGMTFEGHRIDAP